MRKQTKILCLLLLLTVPRWQGAKCHCPMRPMLQPQSWPETEDRAHITAQSHERTEPGLPMEAFMMLKDWRLDNTDILLHSGRVESTVIRKYEQSGELRITS